MPPGRPTKTATPCFHEICREEAITVLWATHLVDEVWPQDQVAVLHHGRIKGFGSVAEILSLTGAADVLEAFKQLTDTNGGPANTQP